ncbi:GFA family protein [Sphingomonas sp. IC081]|uniref:GFA family protein n=1 Tax=Sphingomonas sp. IC081 TaxID=304378 RepID=UPI00115C26B4|nr:GFA family protein [Sphingomonas sp. IC081]QDK32290.1 aldehyde-activating protein [Sphingomonas sp. IC081]
MSEGAEGGCTCGQVRYRLLDDPIVVHCCHCRWCQRETGSACALNAVIEADRVELVGKTAPERIETPSLSGKGQAILRCPACKVALWSHYGGAGDRAAYVRVGTLDHPDAFPPDVHIFTGSRQPWVVLPERAEQYEVFYSGKDVVRIYGDNAAARWKVLRSG